MNIRWDAEEYARSSSAQAEWGRELMASIPFAGDEAVLDIGCGDGKVTVLLAEKVARGRVVGVDSSVDMVTLARERYGAASSDRLRFEVMNARALSFDVEIDVVFSNSTLHWIEDHRPVLAGIRRALKPGGRAYLRFGGKGATKEITALLYEFMQRPEWAPYFEGFVSPMGFFEPAEYIPWLEEAGLTPERVELLPRTMRHTVDNFTAWVRTTKLPYTQRVPEAERERFIRELVAEYIKRHPPDAEGKIGVTMNRLDVVASRPK
ncbi:MAG: methyltransferase domain-containing protein [Candidatus Hydrogenedentales bacterium]